MSKHVSDYNIFLTNFICYPTLEPMNIIIPVFMWVLSRDLCIEHAVRMECISNSRIHGDGLRIDINFVHVYNCYAYWECCTADSSLYKPHPPTRTHSPTDCPTDGPRFSPGCTYHRLRRHRGRDQHLCQLDCSG